MEENTEELSEQPQPSVEFKKPQSTLVKWLRHSVLAVFVLFLIASPTIFYALGELNSTKSTFSILYPGEQFDILKGTSTSIDTDLKTYSVENESLFIATVKLVEGPSTWEVLLAKFNPEADILKPNENTTIVYNVPTAIIDYNEDEIGVSLNYALASAFNYLKIPYDSSLDITDVTIISQDGTKRRYDYVTLTELDGEKITTFKQVEDYMFKIKDDSQIPLKVTLRNGEVHDLTVTPSYSKTLGRYALGFYAIPRFVFPADYKFNIQQVSGGSAGLMLAVAAVERFTEERILPEGERIGGTGAITSSGEVIDIAGLPQKIIAAHKAKNTIFFIPASMCEKVTTQYSDMKIIPVKTLEETLNQLKAIKAGSKINSCPVK